MSDSKIEWTNKVWNPLRGCSKVSEGCRNCYAMRQAHRQSGPGKAYEELTRNVPGKGPQWTGKVRTVPELLGAPLRWTKPSRIFVNSMSDLFHPDVPFEFVDMVFCVMALATWHDFQILTKRPERMREYITREGALDGVIDARTNPAFPAGPWRDCVLNLSWPPSNVWPGTSVEDQETADARINELIQIPAWTTWLSIEPILGPIDLSAWLGFQAYDGVDDGIPWTCFEWVVVGGESGPGARSTDVAWIRDVVRQCKRSETPVFVKQLGADVRDRNDVGFYADEEVYTETGEWTNPTGWPSRSSERVEFNPNGWREDYQGAPVRIHLDNRKGGDPSEWPEDLRVREYPEPYPGFER